MWVNSVIVLPKRIINKAVEDYLNCDILHKDRECVVSKVKQTGENEFQVNYEIEIIMPDEEDQ